MPQRTNMHLITTYRLRAIEDSLNRAYSVARSNAFTPADLAWFRSPIGGSK